MKKSEAKPGTKVLATYAGTYEEYEGEESQIVAYHYDDECYGDLLGVIRSREASPGKVWVKWIEGEYLDNLEEEESEVDLKILTLESERSKIEEDFKKVSKEIKGKMKEAAKLVNEAGKMARSVHSTLANMGASYELVTAMDSAGWRSSSWNC